MRIFADANVLFSASNAASNIHAFLHLLHDQHELVTSPYAFHEAERNIVLKRPQWVEVFQTLAPWFLLVEDAPLKIDIALVEKDRPILGAAIFARCDYLLTGDKKDFGHLYGKQAGGVTIVSYTMLAEILLA